MLLYPNLYFIGGMRCGSTTIHNLLNQHPEINMSSVKEPYFWRAQYLIENDSIEYGNFIKLGRYRTYNKYCSLFEFSNPNIRYHGESSHYLYHKNVAQVIKKNVPNAKIIICLRNPINRLKSEFGYLSETKVISNNINSWIESELINNGRVKKGLYFSSVKHYLEIFGNQNVYIMYFEDMINNQENAAKNLFKFLDLNEHKILNVHREKNSNHKNLFRSVYLKYNKILRKLVPKHIRLYFVNHIETKIKLNKRKIGIENIRPDIIKKLQEYYYSDIEELSNLLKVNLISKWF